MSYQSLSRAVTETFCRLHEDGIIYHANRLMDQKQLSGRTLLNVPGYDAKEKFEFGVITSFAYQIEGSDERIVVATTRPETMLGDTAIAVHQDDDRYKHLHGKFAIHPFLNRRLPIIFGTGAVKITPAHDPNDYEVGVRHGLEFINILNDDGTFNENAGEDFKEMKHFHARREVIKKLTDLGLFVETKDNAMQIPICSKSGDIIEPVLKPRWWVNCQPFVAEAIKRTRAGELSIAPSRVKADWYRWLENIQDWCVSRQLWWGHRCPAYFVQIEGERNDGKNWVVGRTVEEATERARILANGKSFTLEQDEDVLDTWFSSGLWPFLNSGMARNGTTVDFSHYYPASILETGWDILFFWAARMISMGIYLTGQMPFSEVLCHAMIRDAHGRKMSKSLGNVIHGLPLEQLHQKLYKGNLDEKEILKAIAGQKKGFPKGIPECGTDGLRFALCAYSGSGRDINLEILRVEGYRKFCNKTFNHTKLAMLKLDDSFSPETSAKPTGNESLVECWILHKLDIAATQINTKLQERNFMAATRQLTISGYTSSATSILRVMKPLTDASVPIQTRRSAQQTLYSCLDHGLRLLHPFMPFVTKELWQRLPRPPTDPTPSIMIASYPINDPDFISSEEAKDFDVVLSAVRAARSLAASYNLQSNIQPFVHSQTGKEIDFAVNVIEDVKALPAGCGSAVINSTTTVHVLVKLSVIRKLTLARLNLEKIMKIVSQPDYAETVPSVKVTLLSFDHQN
ncbi:tRNA synthetases class I-domain-containing protein [Suillus cothurnatus]|nr:tRNA synthetases class I-domain-containing protein [Suillus cothurnatus]